MTCAHTSWSPGSTAHDPRAGTRRRWALFLTFENEVLVNRAVADFLARANASVEALSEKLRGLKARQLELTDAIEDSRSRARARPNIAAIRATIRESIASAPDSQRKALLQDLVG